LIEKAGLWGEFIQKALKRQESSTKRIERKLARQMLRGGET
jgi:hypothetical protein